MKVVAISAGARRRLSLLATAGNRFVTDAVAIGHTLRMNVAPIKPPITPKLLDQIDVRVGTIENVGDVDVPPLIRHVE